MPIALVLFHRDGRVGPSSVMSPCRFVELRLSSVDGARDQIPRPVLAIAQDIFSPGLGPQHG